MTRFLRHLLHLASPWLRSYRLNRRFWLFFTAALFWDAGFGLFLFLFNLYLLDFHMNERAIGLINGALSLGVVAGTLPAGAWARRIGARRLLILCFLGAPVLNVVRAFFVWEPAAIALAFLAGVVMCIWAVCFLPVTASLTSEENRAAATGLIFSVGVGATAFGSAASGYLFQWIGSLNSSLGPADVKRILLLLSSAIVACGAIPMFRLPEVHADSSHSDSLKPAPFRQNLSLLRQSFLRRFLPCMAVWSGLIAAFIPFAAVYFTRQKHVPLTQVALIFSASQLAQLMGGLLVPLVVRSFGLMRGIVISQLATGILLALTAFSSAPAWCIAGFLSYSAAQWICSPAMYTMLMNSVAEVDRNGASALIMFSNFLVTAAATSATGLALSHFGYPAIMLTLAALECALAVAFRLFIPRAGSPAPSPAPVCAQSFTD